MEDDVLPAALFSAARSSPICICGVELADYTALSDPSEDAWLAGTLVKLLVEVVKISFSYERNFQYNFQKQRKEYSVIVMTSSSRKEITNSTPPPKRAPHPQIGTTESYHF